MNITRSILSLNGFPIQQAEKELSDIQALSPDAFIAWQQNKAWDIVRFHFNNNSFYRTKVGKYFPDKWEDLPVVTKKDLQQPLASLISKGVKLNDCYKSSTSGSSGVPLFFAKDKYTHAMTWALIANRYSWHNIHTSDKQARFYGISKEWKSYWKEKLKDKALNRERFSVLDLSDKALDNFVTLFSKNAFRYMYGYTSALTVFARHLLNKNIILTDICPSLQLCISTSELSTVQHTKLFTKAFGVKHIREYGASETCITGFDDKDNNCLLTEETLYNEVVDNAFMDIGYGKQGALLTTSLFNKALPMIRYQLGDELVLAPNQGNSIYRIISQFSGRTNDVIQLPGNKKAGGMTLYYLTGSVMERLPVIKEWIIRQTAIDTFIFEMVTERTLNNEEEVFLKDKIATYLDAGLTIKLQYVSQIERPISGKLKLFYSELV